MTVVYEVLEAVVIHRTRWTLGKESAYSWEARNQPRTIDYPFTLIQLHVDKNGQGEGKFASICGTFVMDPFAKVVRNPGLVAPPCDDRAPPHQRAAEGSPHG